jgi:hypothetical protein
MQRFSDGNTRPQGGGFFVDKNRRLFLLVFFFPLGNTNAMKGGAGDG